MYKKKNILAVTLARGGSKSIPKKNITPILGRPLIWYSINEVQKVSIIDNYLISTDSMEIKDICERYNAKVPFLRPAELSSDNTSSAEAIIHCVKWCISQGMDFDYVVEVMATNPLKSHLDIENCIKLAIDKEADSCVAVHKLEDHHPSRIKYIENGYLRSFYPEVLESRRQDLKPEAYIRSGSIYVTKVKFLLANKSRYSKLNTMAYILPNERVINIDSKTDLEYAKFFLKNFKKK